MKNPNDSFLKGRIRSLKFAFKGAFLLLTTEHSIMVQFSLGILVTILGFVMDISATEWMFQLIAVGMVLV
ncbi:MAG TPA: diacylglycerol kinase family protein, partial [Flavobacteriaceae bacterium]|nr:diacylglycerol kinase family protein [Flavobacteriaceae bacterium]